jgi:hypothetical protein
VKLTTARLCLNCDEIHDAQTCPVCTSETFAYLTRWIPRAQPEPRRTAPPPTFAAAAAQPSDDGVTLNVITGLTQRLRRAQSRVELMALRKAGELR